MLFAHVSDSQLEISAKKLDKDPCYRAGYAHWKNASTESPRVFSLTTVFYHHSISLLNVPKISKSLLLIQRFGVAKFYMLGFGQFVLLRKFKIHDTSNKINYALAETKK